MKLAAATAVCALALVLAQGTIKTEGTPTFGDSVKPLLNVRTPNASFSLWLTRAAGQ